jgi:hypothetical protein
MLGHTRMRLAYPRGSLGQPLPLEGNHGIRTRWHERRTPCIFDAWFAAAIRSTSVRSRRSIHHLASVT